MNGFLSGRQSSIRQSFGERSSQKGTYRFFNNENVTESALIEACLESTTKLCAGKHILVVNDTTEINLQSHAGRIKADSGFGLTGNNKDLGFFAHLGLAIDVEAHQALGFSSMQLWHRPIDKGDKHSRGYQQLAIEEKESYKWLKSATDSQLALEQAASITMVGDRESDLYELFCEAAAQNIHLVVRNRVDRKTSEGIKLYEQLATTPACGSHTISINGDVRKQVKKRTAELEIRYKQVTILKPSKKKDERSAQQKVWIVEAKEPTKTNGICWRLFTTHALKDYADAVQIIEWYRMRWYIEEVFRLLKSKGYQIEQSQIESGWALRKLTVMLLQTVLRVMQMLLAYASDEEQDARITFTADEIELLKRVVIKREGKTEKLKNKHNQGTLKWATWIIARLGGWSGYESQRPPGPITLKNGLDKFNAMYQGWLIAKDVGTQ